MKKDNKKAGLDEYRVLCYIFNNHIKIPLNKRKIQEITMEESILDKVIDSQKSAVAMDFNPQQILNTLLKSLNEREVEVLTLRYGLADGQKKTLEEIGGKFQVTRERIRQIENSALKKIRNIQNLEEILRPVEVITGQVLEDHGGIMHLDSLIKKILLMPGASSSNYAIANFVLAQLLNDKFHFISGDKELYNSLKIPTTSLDEIKALVARLTEAIGKAEQPLPTKEIISLVEDDLEEHVAEALLEINRALSTNPFKEWGLTNWNSISLKRMSDKIYLILKKETKPLHFTDIAKKINEAGFDRKKANPATIHNELILDKKYVLVGRGIYALQEWGYKAGVVADVIAEILKEAKRPMGREEIIEKVLEKRLVKRSTVILALMNKENFIKNKNGEYSLKNAE